nr:MAG TPA: hypothetical protein [Caudoviricetes sp.]
MRICQAKYRRFLIFLRKSRRQNGKSNEKDADHIRAYMSSEI